MPPGTEANSWSTRKAREVMEPIPRSHPQPAGSSKRLHAFHSIGPGDGAVLRPRLDVQPIARVQPVVVRLAILEGDRSRQAEQHLVIAVGVPVVPLAGSAGPLPGVGAVLRG